MKRKNFGVVILVLLSIFLHGFGSGMGEGLVEAEEVKSEKIELLFYFPTQVGGDLASGMEEIVKDFNEQNDKIEVTAVYTGSYKQTAQKAMADIAAKNGPNVILSGLLDLVDYHNVDALEDLKPYIEKEDKAWQEDFVEGFWESFKLEEDKIFGLPFQHSVNILFCNTDMLKESGIEEVPTSWEDLAKAVEKLMEKNGSVVPFEFPSHPGILENLTLCNDGKIVEDKTKTCLDSKEAVEALDFMISLVKAGATINDFSATAEDFVAETAAMVLTTNGNLAFVAKNAEFNWDVAPMPTKEELTTTYGGGGLIMLADQCEEEKAASWEFMKYMTSPEVSAKWMTVSGYFAVRKSADEVEIADKYYKENPQLEKAKGYLEYVKSGAWSTDKYWDVHTVIQNALDLSLVDESISAEEALQQAQKEATELLTK